MSEQGLSTETRVEPSVAELLADPVALALMRADKLIADDVAAIFRHACRKSQTTGPHGTCGDRDRLCRAMCLHDLFQESQTLH